MGSQKRMRFFDKKSKTKNATNKNESCSDASTPTAAGEEDFHHAITQPTKDENPKKSNTRSRGKNKLKKRDRKENEAKEVLKEQANEIKQLRSKNLKQEKEIARLGKEQDQAKSEIKDLKEENTKVKVQAKEIERLKGLLENQNVAARKHKETIEELQTLDSNKDEMIRWYQKCNDDVVKRLMEAQQAARSTDSKSWQL